MDGAGGDGGLDRPLVRGKSQPSGGGWGSTVGNSHLSERGSISPASSTHGTGFRIARTWPEVGVSGDDDDDDDFAGDDDSGDDNSTGDDDSAGGLVVSGIPFLELPATTLAMGCTSGGVIAEVAWSNPTSDGAP